MGRHAGLCGWIVIGVALFLSAGSAWGATFDVSTVGQFQNALNTAATNDEDDVINVAANPYTVTTTLTYNSSENRTLTINGAGTSATRLDGGNTVQILSITTTQANADIVIRNITFRNGTTSQSGGGLRIQTSAAAITIADCEINDNAATGIDSVGGGANLNTNSGTITVASSTFRSNTSAANVGGLFAGAVSGAITLTQCTFEQNEVSNAGGSDYFGDGGGAMLYSDGAARITVRGNTFSNNTASGGSNPDGGGIMTYQLGRASAVIIENNTFSNNRAGLGGGGCFTRINASGNVEYHNNAFSSNTTRVGGGAGSLIYVNDGGLNYTGNTYNSNNAAGDGGGAFIDFLAGNVKISGNTYTANVSSNNGGGMVVVSDSATVSISKNIFNGNQAGNVGGGLSYATTNGSLSCSNNTFYNNTTPGDGGGMYLYCHEIVAQSTLRNNILWHDQPNEFNYSFGTGGGVVTMTYSDAENSSGEPWFGTGCISGDPLFANPVAGDLRLTWAHYPRNDTTKSPCIDTGDPASPKDPDGTRADMGAICFKRTLNLSSIMMFLLWE
jgi:hypothetical protein